MDELSPSLQCSGIPRSRRRLAYWPPMRYIEHSPAANAPVHYLPAHVNDTSQKPLTPLYTLPPSFQHAAGALVSRVFSPKVSALHLAQNLRPYSARTTYTPGIFPAEPPPTTRRRRRPLSTWGSHCVPTHSSDFLRRSSSTRAVIRCPHDTHTNHALLSSADFHPGHTVSPGATHLPSTPIAASEN